MTKYIVRYSSTFKKKLKKIIKRGKDINKLIFVVERLANKEELERKYPNFIMDNIKIEDIMLMYVKGEK